MSVKLLTEHHLEFLCLTGGCIGSSDSTLVKMSNCWKSHAMAQMIIRIHKRSTALIWSVERAYTCLSAQTLKILHILKFKVFAIL